MSNNYRTALGRKKESAGTNCAGINSLKNVQEIYDQENFCGIFPSSKGMEELIYGIPDWLEVRTFLDVADLMRGMDDELAVNVARNVKKFCWGMGRTVTGLSHLDFHLSGIYDRIYKQAEAQGRKLEPQCWF